MLLKYVIYDPNQMPVSPLISTKISEEAHIQRRKVVQAAPQKETNIKHTLVGLQLTRFYW